MNLELNIMIRPHWENDTISFIDYELNSPNITISSGEPMICRFDDAFGGLCPFPVMEYLKIEDEKGVLRYEENEIPSFNSGIKCFGYFPERAVEGTLRWCYRALPRVLPEGYRSSPYYDFRAEPGGLNGSGFFSFLLPATEKEMNVSLSWDMSCMPAGSRAIFSFGEGNIKKTMNVIDLGISLFTVGMIRAVENDSLGIYYLSEPEFQVGPIAEKLFPIFQYEKEYFNDPNASFKIFLRRDPFVISNGGSACRYAFISGYSAFGGFDPDKWFNTLLHEMTHTWPYMDDNNVGEGTWFTEGATEYYCTWLPYIGGFLDDDFTVKCLNEKIGKRYYQNPFREMPNMEIPKIQWKERHAQECPYGRGFLYLANTEAQLRRTGKGSIDDMIKQFGWDRPMHPEDWREFLRERLGQDAVVQFDEMTEGKLLEPDPDIFENRFRVVKDEIELNGQKVLSYHFETKNKKENHSKNKKLPLKVKFALGVSNWANNLLILLNTYFLLYFYTDIVGISGGTAGVIMLIARVWDAVNDPMMGVIVDKTRSKEGKCRFWLKYFSVPAAVVLFLSYFCPAVSTPGKVAWVAVTYILQGMASTVLSVSSNALTARVTDDPDERVLIQQISSLGDIALSLTIPSVTLPLATVFAGKDQNIVMGFAGVVAVYSVIYGVLRLISWKGTEGYDTDSNQNEKYIEKSSPVRALSL